MNVIEHVAEAVKPTFTPAKRSTDKNLMGYAALAKEVGVEVPQLIVEDFMAVMEKKQYPIYNRAEVVKYMDAKAAKDSAKGLGWEWKPIRAKDRNALKRITFGTPSFDGGRNVLLSAMWFGMEEAPQRPADGKKVRPASDYLRGESAPVYTQAIPLHALQRIAAIERDYQGPVCFVVSDYTTAPHLKPDPFLMAILPNVPHEQGCFVIDFWDEPGFGIDKMLAAP